MCSSDLGGDEVGEDAGDAVNPTVQPIGQVPHQARSIPGRPPDEALRQGVEAGNKPLAVVGDAGASVNQIAPPHGAVRRYRSQMGGEGLHLWHLKALGGAPDAVNGDNNLTHV